MNNQINSVYDAIVIGAGVIGASLALSLAKRNGWTVALIEQNEALKNAEFQPVPNIRATALGLSSKSLLTDLGVWHHLSEQSVCPYENMFVWDENSDGELTFAASDYDVEALGFIVDHFALQEKLQDLIDEQQNIEPYYLSTIEGYEASDTLGAPTWVNVRMMHNDAGKTLKARWVFAADGVNSQVRRLAGISTSEHDYQQQGIVAKIRSQHGHQNTAWQRFLSSGPIALLPLESGECSIVWSLPTNQAKALYGLSEVDFSKRLTSVLQARLGEVELTSARHMFPLKSRRTDAYLKASVVLVGDAAHGIHPMAGQGANLGFDDIDCLLNAIEGMSADHPKLRRALRHYERQQKLSNGKMDAFMTSLDSIFRTDNTILTSLRRVGLKAVNQHSLIKELLAQQVLGKTP